MIDRISGGGGGGGGGRTTRNNKRQQQEQQQEQEPKKPHPWNFFLPKVFLQAIFLFVWKHQKKTQQFGKQRNDNSMTMTTTTTTTTTTKTLQQGWKCFFFFFLFYYYFVGMLLLLLFTPTTITITTHAFMVPTSSGSFIRSGSSSTGRHWTLPQPKQQQDWRIARFGIRSTTTSTPPLWGSTTTTATTTTAATTTATTDETTVITPSSTTTTTKTKTTKTVYPFIDTKLRGAAMKLHTREQAPKEGQAKQQSPQDGKKKKTLDSITHAQFLQFLVDSYHVYQTLEELVQQQNHFDNDKDDVLAPFRNTQLERTNALRHDIAWMMNQYFSSSTTFEKGLKEEEEESSLSLYDNATTTTSSSSLLLLHDDDNDVVVDPFLSSLGLSVGPHGKYYAMKLHTITSIPIFVCHWYNFYFAHTAGGRIIGKQIMNHLLLDSKQMQFYQVCLYTISI